MFVLEILIRVASVIDHSSAVEAGKGPSYIMNDEYIHYVGHGKEDTYIRYGSIHKVTVHNSRNMLEVKGAVVSIPVFAAHEDFGFVRDYIIRRLPGNAKVLYE